MKTIKVKSTSSNDKVTHSVIEKELDRLKKRMSIANLSKATIISYCRGLKKLYDFHKSNPRQLEYDEIIDFLIYLKDERTIPQGECPVDIQVREPRQRA